MATIQKRKNDDGTTGYRAMIRLKGHPMASATFTRLTDAREWARTTEADMKAGRYFAASKRKTLGELFDKYEVVAAPKLKSWNGVKRRLDWWRQKAGANCLTLLRLPESRNGVMNCSPRRNRMAGASVAGRT